MPERPSDIAFTDSVKAAQAAHGSRGGYARMEQARGWRTTIDDDLRGFVAGLDMFYLATASAAGQPYVQYRGGPPGFLRPLDDRTLGFADFAGNKQYITLGNLAENPRAMLFLIDYATQQRVKIWGDARVVEGDTALQNRLGDPQYAGRVERAIVIDINAWDINCPQHIHRRLAATQVAPVIQGLQAHVAALQAQVRRLGGVPTNAPRSEQENAS